MRRNTIAFFFAVLSILVGVIFIVVREYYYFYAVPVYVSYILIGSGVFLIIAEVVLYNKAF